MDDQKRCVLVQIRGRVQGVWFRDWTRKKAEALGLGGWVRNRPDGSVEALFFGPSSEVGVMLEKCHKGPALARVDEVRANEQEGCDIEGFEIRGTG